MGSSVIALLARHARPAGLLLWQQGGNEVVVLVFPGRAPQAPGIGYHQHHRNSDQQVRPRAPTERDDPGGRQGEVAVRCGGG
jgi:hypothetical protein